MPAIRLTQLTKDYGDVRALDGLDISVEPGQVFGFLGPNGAGKTTALRIMLDLIRPTSGHAEVLGFDTQSESVEVRRRVGYLPDDPQMYDHITGERFLEFMSALRSDSAGDPLTSRVFRDSLCDRLQLDPTRRIGTLSRGNRQKVGVVLALMSKPELVVLDEPTTGLDPLVREEVELLLKEIAADGRTVFFSSHVLSEVEQVCDRVAMLRDGRLIDVLEPREERRLAPQRYTVTFAARAPAGAVLAAIEGVTVISATASEVVLETTDGADALVKCLANYTVARLETHEVSLEGLFLSYYQPETAAGGGS